MGAPAGAVRRTTALRTGELAGGTASQGRAARRSWANEKGAGQYRRRALLPEENLIPVRLRSLPGVSTRYD